MLDLDRLKRVKLRRVPYGQLLVAKCGLAVDYRLPRATEIVLEGTDKLPETPVVFAMNHTDRFNYWPFQYQLYRQGHGYTATWVKGKYYEQAFVGWFMDRCNNIPVPSRGYVITTQFRAEAKRVPMREEYRLLRDLVDGNRTLDDPLPADATDAVRDFIGRADFLVRFERLFNDMMDEVVRLNRYAFGELGLHLLVFPQGTRSRRLTRGHIGMVQMAQALGATIVPVGCNGTDKLYPGNSPFSKGGRCTYRIGEPLRVDGPEFAPFRVPQSAVPFTRAAAEDHGEAYRIMTDTVMDRINELLDPEYRYGDPTGPSGVERFVE